MVGFIFSCILFIAGIITVTVGLTMKVSDDSYYEKAPMVVRLIGCAVIVFAIAITCSQMVVKVNPDTIGIVYNANGSAKTLSTGYNIKAPWAIKKSWSSKANIITFSEGDGVNDIYGAQTSEKDYISVVATMSVRIDVNRLSEYIVRYGDAAISDEKICQLLKTTSRTAIENVISRYTTSDVMSNKAKINSEAFAEFKNVLSEQPLVIDSFTLDDLVAPESYEQAIRDQAELRMNKQKAELQKEVNEAEASANKIKAEGEAAVAEVNANNAAAVAKIKAQNDAEVKKINAENEAAVKKINADAEANQIKIKSEAEAQATIVSGEAEAKASEALAQVYKATPELYELKRAEITAEVQKKWAEKWGGYDFSGISSFSFADVSDLLNELLLDQN